MNAASSGGPPDASLLVVAGPGRSGTSLFTGLVSRLGMYVPRPEVKADKTNPRGFSEPRWAVEFHKELLTQVAVTIEDGRPRAWDIAGRVVKRPEVRRRLRDWLAEQVEQSDRVVVKDPRLAWFLELYHEVSTELGVSLRVVTMVRHPTEAMKSREIAYGSGAGSTTRLAGWLNLMLSVESRTRDLPRAMVSYDDLLADWQDSLGRVEQALDLPLTSKADAEQIRDAGELVDPSLRRSLSAWDEHDLPIQLQTIGERTFQVLTRSALGDPRVDPAARSELDELRTEFFELYRQSENIVRSSMTGARVDERRRLAREARQEAERKQEEERTRQASQAQHAQASPRSRGGVRTLTSRILNRVLPRQVRQ
jgi:hypothetical protein